jgi:hypothetical protein
MELMIAIVILGLGMIMVAMMFPIAWDRARTLSEATTKGTITDGADSVIKMLARVDGHGFDASSFAGDMVFNESKARTDIIPPYPGFLLTDSDTRMHLLHMENVRISDPRAFVPERLEPWNDLLAPWRLERVVLKEDTANICYDPDRPEYCQSLFLSPQVRFEQRVHPPMRPRSNVDASGVFTDADAQWDDILDKRRYAWAVFYRLREPIGPDRYIDYSGFDAEGLADEAADLPREFDVYYVTLRRPQSTLRYARQDPATAPFPDELTEVPVVVPAARPPADDVMLPEPWRVQIQLPNALFTVATATGIPTEVQAPPPGLPGPDDATQTMLAQMFQRGAWFVDEISGQVYRVVKRRLSGDGKTAFLTLDREMTVEDMDLADIEPGHPLCPTDCWPNIFDPEEQLRTVWVFPPPVQATRLSGDVPIFDGRQPVIGIEMRSLTMSPRR